MSNLSSGKYAKFISDRSGQEFPYSEMVIEWNGARVHTSEFEKKHCFSKSCQIDGIPIKVVQSENFLEVLMKA